MPLIKGDNPKAIARNIKKEIQAGKKPSQAIAIAMSVAKNKKHEKKEGKGHEKEEKKKKSKK